MVSLHLRAASEGVPTTTILVGLVCESYQTWLLSVIERDLDVAIVMVSIQALAAINQKLSSAGTVTILIVENVQVKCQLVQVVTSGEVGLSRHRLVEGSPIERVQGCDAALFDEDHLLLIKGGVTVETSLEADLLLRETSMNGAPGDVRGEDLVRIGEICLGDNRRSKHVLSSDS